MKKLLLLFSFLLTSLFSIAQTTYVPDNNFEQALIDLGYDDVLDDYVSTSNINTITDLNVDSKEIVDLTGIEDFAALELLECSFNSLESLDVSQNQELKWLRCFLNNMTSIELGNNSSLLLLECYSNSLTSIDVSGLPNLMHFSSSRNQLTVVDISQNTELNDLSISSNLITNLDLTQNTNLKDLYCDSNQLTSLDISQNLELERLNFSDNQISNIELTEHTNLTILRCNNNQLSNIDISQNILLKILSISGNNMLSNLDLNQNVNIAQLGLSDIPISNLDVTQNINLELLESNGTQISNFDLTSNIKLIWLDIGNPLIQEINLSENRNLRNLSINNTSIQYLDISNNINLVLTYIADNLILKNINFKNGRNIVNNTGYMDIQGDSGYHYGFPSHFRTIYNPNLTCIQVDDATWSTDNWENIDSQAYFSENCSDFQLNICDDNGDGVSTFDLTSLDADIIATQTSGDYSITFHELMTDAINNSNSIATPNNYNNTQTPQTIFVRVENNATNEFEVLLINLISIVHPVFPSTYEICDEDFDGFTSFDLDDLNADVIDNEEVVVVYYLSNVDAQSESNPISSPFTNIVPNTQTIYIRSESTIDESCFEISTIDFTATPCDDLTYVPDDNFEQALIDLGYDDVIDNYVVTNSINIITNLNIDNKGIADLTGISDFIALKFLSCNNNNLTSINPSIEDNYELRELYCRSNLLESINVSKLYVLTKLDCSYNKLDYLLTYYNTGLKELYCQNNMITGPTGLYLKQNYYLENLNCNNNELEVLDLKFSNSLKTISCNNNNLTELSLGYSPNLISFTGSNNNFTDLNARNSNYENITGFNTIGNPELYCIQVLDPNWSQENWTDVDTQLSFSVDCSTTYVPDDNFEQALIDLGYDFVLDDNVITANIDNVTSLDLSTKSISDLTGIEGFTDLTSLQVNDNNLTSINLSQNLLLSDLNASNNQLTELNIKNGNNVNFTEFITTGNSSLYCILVDDNAWSEANWTSIDSQTSFSVDCSAVTNIPDNNFEQVLIDLGYDFVLDDYVLTSNIVGITDLDLSSKSINDLTGLQDFIGLINFDCSGNNIPSFDISNSSSLTTLNASNNALSVLNISQNNSLIDLNVSNNQLSSLNVKNDNNTNFTGFDTTGNAPLTCIQVDNITWSQANWTNIDAQSDFSTDCGTLTYIPDDNFEQALIDLGYDSVLDDYVITSNIIDLVNLDISSKSISNISGLEDFSSLETLDCSNNQLQTLGLDYFYDLKTLNCSNNQLTALDPSSNWYLENLNCSNNQIEGLILILNFSLIEFNCSNNDLTEVIIKNETNEIITDFSAVNNPNLMCISVDNATYSAANWTNIDAQTSFNEFCESTYTYIPDDNFEQALIDLGYDDGVLDNYIFTFSIKNITNLGLTGLGISDLTGIEDFLALKELDINENQLITVDLSQNTKLIRLHCQENQLTSLNIENNTLIYELICEQNQLTSLVLGNNNKFYELYCGYNLLTTLDTNSLRNLRWLDCYNNQLESLDFSQNNFLNILFCQNNNLDYLNLKNTTNIASFDIDLRNNPNLTCVLVDDIDFSEDTFTNIDPQTSFSLNCIDDDGDGIPDDAEDINNDGDLTNDDTDEDGIPDYLDTDDDGDSVETIDEISDPSGRINEAIDTDNDGIPNYLDNDDDGDGVLSIDEDYNNNGDLTDDDLNNNGIPDYLDNLVSLSVNEISLFKFKIFPNPFENSFSINIEQEGTYKLYTINGQTIKKGKLEVGSNTIDVKAVNSGMYFVELETSKGKLWSKLIKN